MNFHTRLKSTGFVVVLVVLLDMILILEDKNDEAMTLLLESAEHGEFFFRHTRLSETFLALRGHADYGRLEDMFQAWRKEQRMLYDKLTAARTPP